MDKVVNAEAQKSTTVKIDKTTPTLTFGTATPSPNAAGWNNTDVSVPFSTSDSVSGVASTSPAANPLVLTAEGSAVSGTVAVADKAGNSATFTTSSFKIDKTRPAVTIAAPQSKDYLTSESVKLDFSGTDATSGMGSLVAKLDGAAVTNGQVIDLANMAGSHTLVVSASDRAGNGRDTSVTFGVVVAATVDIDPNTVNLKNQGDKSPMTAYLELPRGTTCSRSTWPRLG